MEEDKGEGSKSDSISRGSDDRRELDHTRRTSLTAPNTFPDTELLPPGFLLEEMGWLANNFKPRRVIQERLWKTPSAITLCQLLEPKGLPESPTIDLCQHCVKNHPERCSEKTEETPSCKGFWEEVVSGFEFWRPLNSEAEARAVPASSSTDDYAEAIPMEVVEWSIRRFLGESRGQSDFPADAFQAASSPNRTSASRGILEPRCGEFVDYTGDDSEKLDPLQVAEPGREGSGVPSLQLLNLKLQEPVLCYTVPNGACEAYRHSVEPERALLEACVFSKQPQFGNPRRRKVGSSGVDEVQSLAAAASASRNVTGGGSNKPSSFKRLKSQENSITEKNSTSSTIYEEVFKVRGQDSEGHRK